MSEANPRAEARHAIRRARDASRRGNYAEAERWTKLAERQAAAAAQLAALPPEPDSIENEEAVRAEIRARVARFVGVAQEINKWEWERDLHAEYSERAAREGLPAPPPLREPPFTEQDLMFYARGEVEEDEAD